MKKIAIISDVHGNYPALKSALQYIESQQCDEIIHTGDVADIGPQPVECLKLLLQHNVLCLMGNHDRDFILGFAEQRNFSHVSKQHREYVFQQLKGYENVFMKFPLYTTRICGGKKLLFEHYCRAGNSGIVTFKPLAPLPSAEIFDEMYKDYDCDFDAVFFGHKHEPFDIVGKRLYVDVGSVGCHPEPNACGIIIEYDDSSWSYRRFSVPYDQDETRKAMTDGPLPDGAGLFDFYFLRKKPKTN